MDVFKINGSDYIINFATKASTSCSVDDVKVENLRRCMKTTKNKKNEPQLYCVGGSRETGSVVGSSPTHPNRSSNML